MSLTKPSQRQMNFNPDVSFRYFTDFLNTVGNATNIDNGLTAANSGTSSGSTLTSAGNQSHRHPGVISMNPGTTSTGRTAISGGLGTFFFSAGEWVLEGLVNVNQLSNAGNAFQFVFGFIDSVTTATQANAVAFLYDASGVSTGSTAATYWQTLTAASSVRTYNNSLTQTAIAANTWVKLKIVVNAAGTSASFYINDTLVATHTTNIPSTMPQLVGFGALMIKSAGTSQVATTIDYLSVSCDFSSRRY